jgi:excisionase family DNA binding protein
MSDLLLTATEVADRLQLKVNGVHYLVRAGKLSCVQISPKKRRFTDAQVQEFIETHSLQKHRQRRVDNQPRKQLPSPRKGGDPPKLSGDSDRAQLRKEMREWQ